ncbi:transglutaminase domain-containing protein [Paenibacillus antri]|uniref:Transglutaminase domain-containing protein n=1 Tax=Paenibacillus antri TaxID=2582848 RepID=A0A5R9G7P4_9BACL|nr:transglutaminase-like domain-containing protein [Paenibacillus antri]TLS50100.1 transglutaminase domain-containing protein [Paenibacillus antri]
MTAYTMNYGLDAETLERKLEMKREWARHRQEDLFRLLDGPLEPEEKLLLKFLFAYMPLHDLADYDGAFFLNHVRQALAVRERMPWGRSVPDDIFLHFVLPYRVNNENVDDSRSVLLDRLYDRVKDLSMADAILETNYWCHETATYVGTDVRTVSPLTLMRTAQGRCGEQSTLAVAALRSIGIPARQCYTPRWAHCDSNHAWVEAWADGRWHFLGACEPEPKLNEGWFRAPARRAMLVNTRVAADYAGAEEICSDHPWYAEINMLDNYAPTKRITIRVVDEEGNPRRAEVHFQLYNFAEFYSIATRRTDDSGRASLTTGYGDLLVHARTDTGWGFRRVRVAEGPEFQLTLRAAPESGEELEWEMTPPPVAEEGDDAPVTEAQRQRHEARMREGTAVRAAFEATFVTEEQADELATALRLPAPRVRAALRKAKGNWAEIAAFLREAAPRRGEWALRLLETLRDKDLADTFRPALLDHLEGAMAYADQADAPERFDAYVLCPRVRHEMIAPYRAFFEAAFSQEERGRFRDDPEALVERLRSELRIVRDVDRYAGMTTPVGTYRMKTADPLSRDILFVAAARSVGVPARLEPLDLRPQYWQAGEWRDARFGEPEVPAAPGEKGTVVFSKAEASADVEAAYHLNFTIARLEDGLFHTLQIPFGEKDVYSKPYEVLAGLYRLTTAVRLSDGTARARLAFFTVSPGETALVELAFPQESVRIPVLGQIGEVAFAGLAGGSDIARAGAVFAWLDPEREPSKHLQRELREAKHELERWGGPIRLFVRDALSSRLASPEGLPDTASIAVDEGEELLRRLRDAFEGLRGMDRPVVVAVDGLRRIRYAAEGYKLGIGAELVRTVKGMN